MYVPKSHRKFFCAATCIRPDPQSLGRDDRSSEAKQASMLLLLARPQRGLARRTCRTCSRCAPSAAVGRRWSASAGQGGSNVEAIYQRKSPVEHVLLRPGMYIGSVEKVSEERYVFLKTKKVMVKKNVSYVPGFVKLFDEILVNAADNIERSPEMSTIEVSIDARMASFIVRNDGKGIPVVIHRKEGVYVPELVLGHLLTGSNFDDTKARYTGGRHGYGAKLTNILSSWFKVETVDNEHAKRFVMEWKDHMNPVLPGAVVSSIPPGEADFTQISFQPDISKFNMKGKVDSGTISVIERRVVDIAGVLDNVDVILNGKLIRVRSFFEYARMFDPSLTKETSASFSNGDWEVIASATPDMGSFHQVSFVNRICTSRGGTHVKHILDKIIPEIIRAVESKLEDSSVTIRPLSVRRKLGLYINARLPNPTFDSQMKDCLTSPIENQCNLGNAFVKDLMEKTNIVEALVEQSTQRRIKAMNKGAGRLSKKVLLNVPKLEDANKAGTKDSHKCTIILTEGDSAKALAVAGLAVVGRDEFGVFPLRGKLLNVRDAPSATVQKSQDITNLRMILGLNFKKKYKTAEDLNTLRYGRVMLMTDQDYDGSHIKGLVINFLHYYWPDLLRHDGFVSEFVTPLLKVSNKKETHAFFSVPEFERWRDLAENKKKSWSIKYYKGLGTSTSKEAKEYFSNLDKHVLRFSWPRETTDKADPGELIDMAFAKKRAQDRKAWLGKSQELQARGELGFVDHNLSSLTYDDFINKELILFSQHDLERSIPSVVDGLKPSQRKVLFAALKRNLINKEMKVGQLAGYCSEQTAYHHGEQSLYSTIINMAQKFVGSSNLPLLYPSGQFGTRLLGGKDAASPRYIFTRLQSYTRTIFPRVDDELLKYQEDDGIRVEPEVYLPLIPMILVNGAEGIGTGWSTFIPAHDPMEVIENTRRRIRGEPIRVMKPSYDGFQGKIEFVTPGKYQDGFLSHGIIRRRGARSLEVTELPIGRWTEDYKKILGALVGKDELQSVSEFHTENEVRFVLHGLKDQLDALQAKEMKIKLTQKLSTSNMHLFDPQGRVQKYETPEAILEDFCAYRIAMYERRREHHLSDLSKRTQRLQDQVRFVKMVSSGELALTGKPKKDILDMLEAQGFRREFESDDNSLLASDDVALQLPPAGGKKRAEENRFDYLLNTPLWDLTLENVVNLEAKSKQVQEEFKRLQNMSPAEIWLGDLDELEEQLCYARGDS